MLRILAALFALLLAPAALAQDSPQARDVAETVGGGGRWARLHAACPADLPRRRAVEPANEALDETACAAAPAGCLAACEAGDGRACFRLARVYQQGKTHPSRVWERLFAAACAGGYAAGCTNRAAGMRNGGYDDDPFKRVGRKSRESCLRRSFARACAGEDAWGCAMLGQSHERGEGGRSSAGEARRAYEKACALAEDSTPCEVAREGLSRLKR
jgi:TPR repeat protein